jgi:hypothetical protein
MAPAMAALLWLNVGRQRQQTDTIMQIIHMPLQLHVTNGSPSVAYSCKATAPLNVMASLTCRKARECNGIHSPNLGGLLNIDGYVSQQSTQ